MTTTTASTTSTNTNSSTTNVPTETRPIETTTDSTTIDSKPVDDPNKTQKQADFRSQFAKLLSDNPNTSTDKVSLVHLLIWKENSFEHICPSSRMSINQQDRMKIHQVLHQPNNLRLFNQLHRPHHLDQVQSLEPSLPLTIVNHLINLNMPIQEYVHEH